MSAILLAACGSSNKAARSDGISDPVVAEAYYDIYIGGTKESGRSRQYEILLRSQGCNALELRIGEEVMSLSRSGEEGHWLAYQQFDDDDPMTKSLLRGELKLQCGEDESTIILDSIYYRETVFMP